MGVESSTQNLSASIVGIGTDVVQITRIEGLYEKFGDKFLYKNYHELEIKEFHKLGKEKRCLFLATMYSTGSLVESSGTIISLLLTL